MEAILLAMGDGMKDKDRPCTSQLTGAVRSDFRFISCREYDLWSLCVCVCVCVNICCMIDIGIKF